MGPPGLAGNAPMNHDSHPSMRKSSLIKTTKATKRNGILYPINGISVFSCLKVGVNCHFISTNRDLTDSVCPHVTWRRPHAR
ncbi:hypothetical protein CCACVL1_22862 [Corchorus capsularis]|uniref:Uncharacterized protein n=1 Tax=Corchorus capsularis TaxID=210143 RepID=A0A1R3GW89_COCAP|nr:hypothetical protein CCACVL1_22862 [Corchorus capsularis]